MEKTDLFLLRLRGLLPSLNPKLRAVAEHILAHPGTVKLQRISELASACGVADSSVTRFVKALGLRNFQELKILMAGIPSGAENEPGAFVYDDITEGDSLESIIEKISYINVTALQETKRILDMREIERAVSAVESARCIDIYGAGGSFVAAENARLRFYRIGKRCQIYSDPNQQAVSASLLGRGDAAIGISNSGRTISTVNALRRAKENKAATICITSYAKTPITRHADICLYTSTRDSAFFQESMVSRIAQIFLIDVIYSRLAVKNFSDSVKLIAKSADALKSAFM